MPKSIIRLSSIILIACLGIVVYSNTFSCPFHFDDRFFIVENTFIRDIHGLLNIWKFYPCRFFVFLSLALNYYFHQLDVFGYHLVNLAIHLICAILVWWLVRLTLSTPAMKENKITQHADLIALFAGLVFVCHPVQIEAVTYICQRAASMAALFYMLGLCCYVKFRLLQDQKTKSAPAQFFYICSLITAIAAMFTKENAITLPLMIFLYEFCFFNFKKDFNWGRFFPFLLTLFITPLTILLAKSEMSQNIHGVVEGATGISPMQYFLTQFRVMLTYIRLVFVPINQNLDYDFPVYRSFFELPVLTGFLIVTTVLFLAQRLFSKYRLVSFSIFWFFLTLLPESSFLPLQDVIFEHRLYLPLVGYSIFLVSGAYYLIGLFYGHSERSFAALRTTMVVLTMIIVCNSVLTYQRNKVWKDDVSLWEDTVRKSPHKARVYYSLGCAYDKLGDFTQAMLNYSKTIEINPRYEEAYNNRGVIYNSQNNLAQAISDYTKAVEIDPKDAIAYNDRGNIYTQQGNFTGAISDYTKAIEINPDYQEAYNDRGDAYDKQGNFTQAISDFNKAVEINPQFSKAYNNRGGAYAKEGNFNQAISDCSRAIELYPEDAESYTNRGVIYAKQGVFSQAIADLNKAIEINPGYLDAYYNRGLISNSQGNFIQAISDFTKAIEINPNYADAYYNRGNSYYYSNNFTQARADYTKAIEINPDNAAVYTNRGIIYNNQGKFIQALSDFSKAIEIDPDYRDAYYNRGNLYYHTNNFIQAQADYSKVIEINPNDGLVYGNRAVTYYQLKEYGKAWADVHKVEELGKTVSPQLINALKQVSN